MNFSTPGVIALLSSGAALGLTCGLTPGPLFALMVSETLKKGRKAGIAVAMAPILTDLPIILLTVFVIAGISGFNLILGIISIAGSFFVAWLGWGTFRSAKDSPEETESERAGADSPAPAKTLAKAVIANFLNPGPYLYWLTVGAPLIIGAWTASPALAIAYLAVFYAFLSGSMAAIVILAGKGRKRLGGRGYAWVMRGLGVILVFFSLYFLYGGIERIARG